VSSLVFLASLASARVITIYASDSSCATVSAVISALVRPQAQT
jgi:hypothetical protein